MPPVLPNRREKMREATLREIRVVARDLLVEEGRPGVTINAVARRMGMSGPALYRYFSSHEELLVAVTCDFYGELTQVIETARQAARAAGEPTPLLPMCRAMRGWAIENPAEFGVMFASRRDFANNPQAPTPSQQAGRAFGGVFLDEISAIWRRKRFPVLDLDEVPPSLAEQLRSYSTRIEGALPPEAAHVFLTCWIRLYGLLCMEILNQLDFALGDVEPFYEECLEELCRLLDVEYSKGPGPQG